MAEANVHLESLFWGDLEDEGFCWVIAVNSCMNQFIYFFDIV